MATRVEMQKPDHKELKKEDSSVGHVGQGHNRQTLDVDWERSIKGSTFHSLDWHLQQA